MPHIHEKIDFTSEVFIVNNGKVLLRLHDKYKFWLSIGGHIELDEDPIQAALREVKEEVGMDIELVFTKKKPSLESSDSFKELSVPEFMNRHRINDTHEHITFVYFAKAMNTKIEQGETEISSGIKWFSREDLLNPKFELRENVKTYALAALDAIK